MECKLLYGSETIGEKLFNGTIEKPVDLDFTLPDYCADIQKILKCNIKPIITAKSVSGEKLEMEGIVSIRVFYLDSIGKELRFCEKAVPFSANASLIRSAISPVIIADTKIEYVNCRAVSSRRLDIHGAFSINAQVIDNGKFEYVKRIDEESIEQKQMDVTLSELCASVSHQFMLSNTLETGSSRPVVENIIRSSEQVRIDDIRNVSGTVVMRGNLLVSIFYSSGIENMNLEKIEYEIPFNESIETAFGENGAIIKVNAQVCDVEIKVKSDSVGENSIISFDAKIVSEILIYKEKEIEVICDAFSREYECEIDIKTINVSHIKEHIHRNEQFISALKLSDAGIDSIIDIWNENSSVKHDDEKFSGKYNVCILYRGKDEKLYYTEKNLDFTYNIGFKEKTEAKVKVLNMDAKVKSSEDIEIKTDVEFDYDLLSEKSYKVLSKLFEDEDGKRIKTDNSVCIYFASEGENIWEIAKEHLCSVNDIKAENSLVEDEFKEAQTIIISM